MKKIGDRRKLHNFNINNEQQYAKVQRTNSRTFSNAPSPIPTDNRKTIKDLQAIIIQERQKRKDVEQQLSILRQRTILREKQFYRVLERTHKQVKKYTQPDISTDSQQDLNKLYEDIFVNFEKTNQATNSFIQDRYRENYCMMERRVGIIIQNFEEQITKNKQLSEDSYKNIKEEIQLVLSLARSIDDENKVIKGRIKEEKFKNKLLNEEKQLLLHEITQKKRTIVKLYKKFQTFEKHSRLTINQGLSKQKNQNLSTNAPPSNIPKFLCEPSIDVSEFMPNKSLNLQQKRNSFKFSSVNTRILKRKDSSRDKQKTIENDEKNQKIIKHLRVSLERERKKVIQLGNIVTKVQNKNNEINEAIVESFQKSKSQSEKLTDLLKSQKLFQTIKDLKKRLAMCQKPTLLCGWGEAELQEILQK